MASSASQATAPCFGYDPRDYPVKGQGQYADQGQCSGSGQVPGQGQGFCQGEGQISVQVQGQYPPQPQVIVQYQIQNAPAPVKYDKLHKKTMIVLGVTQIICGAIAFCVNIAGICFSSDTSIVGHGFWTGVFFVIAGSFGLAAVRQRTRCTIMACMVLSIIASVMAFILLIMAGILLLVDLAFYTELKIFNNILMIIALVEAIVSICQSAFCCAAVCCGVQTQAQPMTVVYTQPYRPTDEATVQVNNLQHIQSPQVIVTPNAPPTGDTVLQPISVNSNFSASLPYSHHYEAPPPYSAEDNQKKFPAS